MQIQTQNELAGIIDHTLLSPTATAPDVRKLCQEAVHYGFWSVCLNPRWAEFAADILEGTQVKVASVVSFPLGACTTAEKVAEAHAAIFAGADELDVVADLAMIVEGNEQFLQKEMFELLRQCRQMKPPVVLKLIIESAALSYDQKRFVCNIAELIGVDFLKTSTGFHPAGGATFEDVKLMKQCAPKCKIKASGGIRTLDQALAMIEAGAERIGTSSGVRILEEFRQQAQTSSQS
jgi:deoxyribose-phosphate aldolase